MGKTMEQIYSDSSNHEACEECGLCITCGDCKCKVEAQNEQE